jgi:ADP-heptose:LPS heptosyltransferase
MMVKKIAVLRANALGDLIFVLPALQALRDHYPLAEIVYLGKRWHGEYLSERPSPVNRAVVITPYPGVGESADFLVIDN